MAYSLDKNPTAKNPADAPKMGTDKDTELAARMCIQMLQEKGLPVLQAAIKSSKDPAQVIGQFIGQMFGMVGEKLSKMGLDMRVFTKKDGVLTIVLNFIAGRLGLNKQQINQIYVEVMNMLKAGAMGGQGGQGQGQAPNVPTGPNSDQDGEGDEQPDQEEAGEDPNEEAQESPEEEQAEEAQEPEEPGENEPPEPSTQQQRKY